VIKALQTPFSEKERLERTGGNHEISSHDDSSQRPGGVAEILLRRLGDETEIAFIEDPNGYKIELIELKGRAQA